MPETFTPASLRGSGATFLCSAWPLDESENNEHLSSGRPGRISEKHRILGLYKKGYSITRYAIELLQNGIDTRHPSTTTYTSGSLA